MGIGCTQQPTQIGLSQCIVLTPRNSFLHIHIEALNTYFKLQHARWKLLNQGLEFVG